MTSFFVLAVSVLIVFFSCAGCSRHDQYSLEREYWKLGRLAKSILDNPDAAPCVEVEKVVKRYNDFSGRCPSSSLAVDADFAVARIYMMKKDSEKARQQLEIIGKKYASPEIKAEACFMAGTTYQDTEWDKALGYYERTRDMYPLTRRGMAVPLYLAEYYRDTFQPDKMTAAYRDAITRYLELSGSHPGTRISFESRLMLSSCYGGLKDWKSAVKTLEELAEEFKDSVRMDGILMNIALIYRDDLKDETRYRAALERLIGEYPASPLARTARALMKDKDGKSGAEG